MFGNILSSQTPLLTGSEILCLLRGTIYQNWCKPCSELSCRRSSLNILHCSFSREMDKLSPEKYIKYFQYSLRCFSPNTHTHTHTTDIQTKLFSPRKPGNPNNSTFSFPLFWVELLDRTLLWSSGALELPVLVIAPHWPKENKPFWCAKCLSCPAQSPPEVLAKLHTWSSISLLSWAYLCKSQRSASLSTLSSYSYFTFTSSLHFHIIRNPQAASRTTSSAVFSCPSSPVTLTLQTAK